MGPSPQATTPNRAHASTLAAYDYRCPRCNWRRTVKRIADPGALTCPECGDGRDLRWWCKRPPDGFMPPPSAAEAAAYQAAMFEAELAAFERGEEGATAGWANPNALRKGDRETRQERQTRKVTELADRRAAEALAKEATRGQAELPGLEAHEDRNLGHE